MTDGSMRGTFTTKIASWIDDFTDHDRFPIPHHRRYVIARRLHKRSEIVDSFPVEPLHAFIQKHCAVLWQWVHVRRPRFVNARQTK
jgi:hypothetical protein